MAGSLARSLPDCNRLQSKHVRRRGARSARPRGCAAVVVASVPMPPSRSKKARIGATRLRRVAIHPADQRANGSAPDVFALDHPGAGSLRLRHRRADPWVLLPAAAAGRWSSRSAARWSSGSAATGSGSSWAARPASMRPFRAALAHSACGPDEVFVGCAFGQRARRCRAEGLFASAVVPEGIPPNGQRWRGVPCGWSSAARWWCCSPSALPTGSGVRARGTCLSLGVSTTSSRLLRGGLAAACRLRRSVGWRPPTCSPRSTATGWCPIRSATASCDDEY